MISLWDTRDDTTLVKDLQLEGSTDIEEDPSTGRLWRTSENGSVDSLGFDGSLTPLPDFARQSLKMLVRFDDGSLLRFMANGDIERAPTPAAPASLRLPARAGKAAPVAFSQPGRWLAVADGARVRVHDLQSPNLAPRIIDLQGVGVERVALNELSELVAISAGGRIRTFELPTLAERWSASGLPDKLDQLIIAAQGQSLIGTWGDGSLRLWDLAQGRMRCSWETGDEPIFRVVVSPAGDRLVVGTDLSRFFVLNAKDCTVLQALDRPDGFAIGMDIRFTHSGRRVVTAAGDGWAHLWDIEPAAYCSPSMPRPVVLTAARARPRRSTSGSRCRRTKTGSSCCTTRASASGYSCRNARR